MENKFKDPESRNRLKQIKTDAQKQIERNKVILKDLVNRYSCTHSGHLCAGREEGPTPKENKTKNIWREARWTTTNWEARRHSPHS